MQTSEIATKADIQRLEHQLEEIRNHLLKSTEKLSPTSNFLTGKQVMQLLNVKDWALRKMRLNNEIKWKDFGRFKRYPIEQFYSTTSNQNKGP